MNAFVAMSQTGYPDVLYLLDIVGQVPWEAVVCNGTP